MTGDRPLLVMAAGAATVPLAVRAALRAGHRARVRLRLDATTGAGPSSPAHLDRLAVTVRLRLAEATGQARRRRASAVAAWLASLSQHLRAGQTLAQALRTTEPPPALAADVGELRARADASGLLDGLRWWSRARAHEPQVRAAAAAIAVAVETGGAALPALEVAEASARGREALSGEVRALTAQARASAVVIGIAPLVMAALTAAVDPRASRFLFTTPLGLALLAVGLALDVAGGAWMALLLRRFRS